MSDNLLDNDQLDPEMIRGLLELRKHFAKRKVCKKDKILSSLIKRRFFTQALENGYGFCDFRNIEIIYFELQSSIINNLGFAKGENISDSLTSNYIESLGSGYERWGSP